MYPSARGYLELQETQCFRRFFEQVPTNARERGVGFLLFRQGQQRGLRFSLDGPEHIRSVRSATRKPRRSRGAEWGTLQASRRIFLVTEGHPSRLVWRVSTTRHACGGGPDEKS